MTEVTVARLERLGMLTAAWRWLSRWWLNELHECTPKAWRHLLQAKTAPRLFIWDEQGGLTCHLVTPSGVHEKRFAVGSSGRSQVDAWLAELGCQRDAVQIGIALEADHFFQRRLNLPRSELDALPRILAQEVIHRTPFQPAEIWHGARPVGETPHAGVVEFRHWIIPRDRAESEFARLGWRGSDIDFIAAKQPGGEPLTVVTFGAAQDRDPPWAFRATRTLALASLAAIVLALVAVETWQSIRAGQLEDALYEARQGVQNGSQGAGVSLRLLALKAVPGNLAIWDELSRVIPDHTFLTELRINGNVVSLAGLSSDAARLVRTLDASRLFAGATLAGPITPDTAERKDRFRMTLKIRKTGVGRAVKMAERPES
ncbi:PilN domain-containing protein [Bradyrhizobium sp. INPA01-394B]|uniref:PilN domain-containing protein n=1 Tax=Bradyrhizobium campsiandrae TaxID=1729892 RepID=A0ABR7UAL6_9BRAD|nr:PilN domain-containing protein [Bradyrhizobium campsiandrae]MBC9882121.1 PilN domain-containing protein [Bradyrhizobium campsiandrae]MBC9981055.1 PilN domain-containing protein [Bradyrhizobium campsiandrae]